MQRLHTEVGELYTQRPVDELYDTVTGAFEANFEVLVLDRYERIDNFINKITHMRLEAGFPLSDVQKAFELYRSIVLPLLGQETTIDQFLNCILKINACLAVTIHRFSDYFQEMHQRRNVNYARQLEMEIQDRTAKLKESETRYKTLVEEINDGYFVIQEEKVVFANEAFCKMHGYRLDEVLDRAFHSFVAPESRDEVIQVYHDSLENLPTPNILEYMRLTRDGRSIPTEFTAKVTYYQHRRSNIGLCRDISDRVRMERLVREAERMADIGRITTSLSHEIRNPLSAVKLNLQILKNNRNLTGNDGRRIDISVREVIRLEGILKELLDFAKPLSLSPCASSLNDIVDACLELLSLKYEEKNLTLIQNIGANLPSIVVDRDKLRQALINLLLNAIEASPPGGAIELTCRQTDYEGRPGVEISVLDQGAGVGRKMRAEIFKPFYTTKSKGTGLGLTNVNRIVEAHQGCVEVEDREPSGAVFRVWLPWGIGYGENPDR